MRSLCVRVGDPDRKGKVEAGVGHAKKTPLRGLRFERLSAAQAYHLDGCVEVASAYYGAPPGWISRRVHVQWNAAHVRLLDPHTGQLLREHLRAPRGVSVAAIARHFGVDDHTVAKALRWFQQQ